MTHTFKMTPKAKPARGVVAFSLAKESAHLIQTQRETDLPTYKVKEKMENTNQQQQTALRENTQNNLDEIELDAVTSSQYFKAKPGTAYVIQIDLDKHKIKPVENPKFTDAQGKPLKRYELVIVHVNNQKEQTWTVSKTVCLQIIEQLRKGFTVLRLTRQGTDRNTTYTTEGVQ